MKSTTTASVATVRDFGLQHIEKWRRGLHWLFAFYDKTGERLQYCIYASPLDMEPWIAQKERYILPDFVLSQLLPPHVDESMVVSILGERDCYNTKDAKWIMKNQWSSKEYHDHMDLENGYSRERMREILALRARYVLARGATLNNPHIEKSYFEGFERITENHAIKLRTLVRRYLEKAESIEVAIE